MFFIFCTFLCFSFSLFGRKKIFQFQKAERYKLYHFKGAKSILTAIFNHLNNCNIVYNWNEYKGISRKCVEWIFAKKKPTRKATLPARVEKNILRIITMMTYPLLYPQWSVFLTDAPKISHTRIMMTCVGDFDWSGYSFEKRITDTGDMLPAVR